MSSLPLGSELRTIFITFAADKIVPMNSKIQYPQTFEIKLVVSAEHSQNDTKTRISNILSDCKVIHSFVSVHSSTRGNYLSYAYKVTIDSKEHLDTTYSSFSQLPGLKFVL